MAFGRILVIDDDENVTELLSLYLGKEGFSVVTADNGVDGLRLATEQSPAPDLVVLDLMLPGLDGWEVCRRIRAVSRVPVIMLTARDDDVDKILGLELGADDYVTKPFNPREVTARVKTVLRRIGDTVRGPEREVRYPGLRVSLTDYVVEAGGRPVVMTPKETELLWFLASHPGQVFSRDQLLREVWGYDYTGDSRTVDTHVKRVRQKVRQALAASASDPAGSAAPEERLGWEIVTVWGVGYKFRRDREKDGCGG